MLERLPELVNADSDLVWRGRGMTARFLVAVGEDEWLVDVQAGRVAGVAKGPFRMASWIFALKGTKAGWDKFWQAAASLLPRHLRPAAPGRAAHGR